MVIIKLNSKELKEVRKDLLTDAAKQEFRQELNNLINSKVEKILIEKVKNYSVWNIENKINKVLTTETKRMVNNKIKDKKVILEKVTKKEIMDKININKIIEEVKSDIETKVFETLGKK